MIDPGDYMCPNCVTPWTCNGPHIPDPSFVEEPDLSLAEPRTQAGRALMQHGTERGYPTDPLRGYIMAIEYEAKAEVEAALGQLMDSITTRDLPRWEKEPPFIKARAALEQP